MPQTKQSLNTTHRKRLARRLADTTGMAYQQAHARVVAAADAGLLPTPLDPTGMDAALRSLTSMGMAGLMPTAGASNAWLDPATHRLMGGPTTTTVYQGESNRRVAPTCDVCNRRLTRGEPWWMVYSPVRNWSNHAGVVCEHHSPASLPLHTTDNNLDKALVTSTLTARRMEQGGEWVAVEPYAENDDTIVLHRHHTPEHVGSGATRGDEAAESEPHETSVTPSATSPEALKSGEQMMMVAHEGNPVPRCTSSSWRGSVGKRTSAYGPGGYNRCVKAEGHAPEQGGNDPMHVDEWGYVFRLAPKFKVVRTITHAEMAQVAREAGMLVASSFGRGLVWHKPEDTLWVTKDKEMVKVSAVYEDEARVDAQVVYPVPPRTTVRSYPAAEVAAWREPTTTQVHRYEHAWGIEN